MANFEPKWNLSTDNTSIKEGQISTTNLLISKNRPEEVSSLFTLLENQYLQLTISLTSTGETFESRDITITCGESSSTLVPVETIDPLNPSKTGTFTINTTTKEYDLTTVSNLNAYIIKVMFNDDGVWDGEESLIIKLESIRIITTVDDQISNDEECGVIDIDSSTILYNRVDEFWVTPSLTVRSENYCIGELSYGADSTLFIQAFGNSRSYNPAIDNPDDKSNRVFLPLYIPKPITLSEVPVNGITNFRTVLNPNSQDSLDKKEHQRLLIKDTTGTDIISGLSFTSTGQILFTFLYQSEPTDSYFKAQIVRTDYFEPIGEQYYEDKKFRAYQSWIAPNNDVDLEKFADPKPLKNHVYILNDTSTYPYTVQVENIQGEDKLVFVPELWKDMGYYDPSLGAGIIGKERLFRFVINDSTGGGINFETDSNLGNIHVGEYFGHTVYPIIKANGSDLITYTIDYNTSPNDIRKFNLDLSPSGALIGTAYARSSQFSANDDINLQFDVVATAKNGKSNTSRFKLRIIRGLQEHTLSAYMVPSINLERAWFGAISSNVFNNFKFYRPWDERYGLQKVPRITIKENLVSSTFNWTSLEDTKDLIRDSIIDIVDGSPVPDSPFKLVLGNYKVRSALDKNGNVLYDILYREILPSGLQVQPSAKSTIYSNIDIISEYYGLRNNIVKILGEDTTNLITDPDDLLNRGLFVEAVDGISSEMLDTVPRYMNHPYEGTGARKGMLVGAVVAYLNPGTGEAAFNDLMRAQEHISLLGLEFDVSFVEFKYYNSSESLPITTSDTFMISLKNKNLLS